MRDSEHIEKAFDFGGMPARNGVAAATMVAHGFTGVDDVFAGERNFFEAYAPEPDPSQLVEGLGERFEILSTNIKKWSVGSPAQSALDALTCLMESEKPAPDEIAAIQVHLPARSARTVDNAPMPDVNVQHLMAMLLVDGRLTFHSVHDRGRMQDEADSRCEAEDRACPQPGVDGGAPAPPGHRGDRAAGRTPAVTSHDRGAGHGGQPDDARRGRGQGARSDGGRARSGARRQTCGGMPLYRAVSAT